MTIRKTTVVAVRSPLERTTVRRRGALSPLSPLVSRLSLARQVLELLADAGADLAAPRENGGTPALMAMNHDQMEVGGACGAVRGGERVRASE